MRSIIPKVHKLFSIYNLPKIQSDYTKKVKNHQYQGYNGFYGKYYGNLADKINPYK